MIIIAQAEKNQAIQFFEESYAIESGLPYKKFESIPDGSGLLKTDLNTLWWEEVVPEPEAPAEPPKPTNEFEVELDKRLTLATDRLKGTEEILLEFSTMLFNL